MSAVEGVRASASRKEEDEEQQGTRKGASSEKARAEREPHANGLGFFSHYIYVHTHTCRGEESRVSGFSTRSWRMEGNSIISPCAIFLCVKKHEGRPLTFERPPPVPMKAKGEGLNGTLYRARDYFWKYINLSLNSHSNQKSMSMMSQSYHDLLLTLICYVITPTRVSTFYPLILITDIYQ